MVVVVTVGSDKSLPANALLHLGVLRLASLGLVVVTCSFLPLVWFVSECEGPGSSPPIYAVIELGLQQSGAA